MTTDRKTGKQFHREIADLRAQLAEAQETLRAIRHGEVDALVVETADGEHVYTLQGAEHDYRLLVEQMHEGAASLDSDGRISYANQCFADMLRRPLEQMIGSRMQEHLAEESVDYFGSLLRGFQRGGIRSEILLKASDGKSIPAQLSLSPQCNGALGWYLVVTDLSDRRRTEQTLANEQFIRRLIDHAPTGVAVVGRDLRYSLANPTYRAIAGDPDISLVGRTIAEALPPSVARIVQPLVQQTLDTGQPLSFHEYEVPVRGRTWWNVRQIPLKDAAGDTEAVLIIADEVTEQVQARAAMQESEERLRLLGDNLPDSAVYQYVRDSEAPGRFTYISAGIERLNGIKVADALRDAGTLHRQILPEHLERLMREELRCVRTFSEFDMDVPMRRPDGQIRWMRLHSRPRRLPDGSVVWDGVQTDITERRRAEEALRESERRFRLALRNAPVSVAAQDRDLRYVWAFNQRSAKSEQIVGRLDSEIFTPEEAAHITALKRRVLEEGIELREQMWLNRPTGRMYLDICWEPICDEAGCVIGVASATVDLTPTKLAEESLAASRIQLQDIINNTPAIVYAFDLEDCFLLANTAIAELLRSTPEQMIGKRRHEFMPKEDADRHEANDRGVIEAGSALEFEEYSQLKGRSITWLTTKFPLRDAQGRIYAVAGISADISERKRQEQQLTELNATLEQRVAERTAELARSGEKVQAERQRFLDVLETLPVIVALLRPDHRVVWVNRAYREALGDNLGQLCYASQFGRDRPCEECQAFIPLQTGQPHNWEWALPNGRTFDIHNFPFADSDGSPMILEMDIDITARKQAEAALAERTAEVQQRAGQLQALAVQLAEAEQKERQRLALLLHDGLQQLLVGTKFHVGILRAELKSRQHREMLKQVDDLLDESLDASRSLTVDLSPPILQQGTMAQVLQWLAQWFAAKHGLVVKVHADENAHPETPEIRALLFQVVRELLFNTVKHAEVDRACVELSRTSNGQIKVVVSDTGKGFDPSLAHGREGEGSGFGLFSIRERLDWLSGRFDVESAPGKGTCATVAVPMRLKTTPGAVPAALEITAPASQARAGGNGTTTGTVRVILADDHAVVRDGLSGLLQRQPDIEVVGLAADGRQAVDMAMQLQPDVIIMDVNMPVMDGKEATRQILARLPNTKIIGLSMFAETDVAEAMREAGAVSYLAKTSGPDALVAAIRRHAHGPTA